MTEPSDAAGDPACWLGDVCPRCGAVVEDGHECARDGRRHLGRLPDGLVHDRTTDVFDEDSVPGGLLRNHRVAAGVWGRLIVHEGSVGFRFEDDDRPLRVDAGEWVVIPPQQPHRVELDGPVRFAVEFHRPAGA